MSLGQSGTLLLLVLTFKHDTQDNNLYLCLVVSAKLSHACGGNVAWQFFIATSSLACDVMQCKVVLSVKLELFLFKYELAVAKITLLSLVFVMKLNETKRKETKIA